MPTPNDPAAVAEGLSEMKQFAYNLHSLAAQEHTKIADHLDALLKRLGRDGLSIEEWNALIGAIHNERLDAWRRTTAAEAMSANLEQTQ